MSGYEFSQRLRRYQNLSQKCQIRQGELNFAYKRALKESNDSYLRLSALAGSTRSKNYASSALPTKSQFSYSSLSTPTKNSLNISRHSPIRSSNFNTNTNININTNSFLSSSPISKRNDAKDDLINDNHHEKAKEEDLDDYMEDSQELFDIIHSKNESPKTNSQIDEEFQRLVQQADDEDNEKNQDKNDKNQKPNEEISIDEEEGEDENFEMNNFEFHSDANEEDINDENEVNFELKEDGNQFEVDEEEEENQNDEKDENPFAPDNENNDQSFEEEESSIRSPDKNVTKRIANKVTSSNDDQAGKAENENASVNSNDEVNDQLPEEMHNNSTLSNTEN